MRGDIMIEEYLREIAEGIRYIVDKMKEEFEEIDKIEKGEYKE